MKASRFGEKFKVKSISAYVRLLVSISTLVTTIIIATAISLHEIKTFKQVAKEQKDTYLNEQKSFIKDLIDGEIDYIHVQKAQFEAKTKSHFQENVENAYKLADGIYQKYQGQLSPYELKQLIIVAISSLEVQNNFSKIFINTVSGEGIYYPGRPEYSGTNLLNLKDVNGNFVIQTEINFLKNENQGFITYAPVSNSVTIPQHKITYLKKFGHFGWYFGSKGYLEDYYDDFKAEIARKTSSTRFRHGGYVFLNETDGTPIVINGEVYQGEFNFYDNTDPKKKAVFELELETALRAFPEGGYFAYEWEKIGSLEMSRKLSYVKLFPEYNWLVGAGYYLDEIDYFISIQQKKLKKALVLDLFQILAILIVILGVQFYFIRKFNKRYTEDFSIFSKFFKSGKGKYKTVQTQQLNFDEFKQMGTIANEMIAEQKSTHVTLLKEQKRAQEADRLKTAFLANMSHEIRTPMNAILGFSELINESNIESETRREFTQIIIENGQHLLGLINDIIDISKIESNQLNISKSKFQLNTMIESIEKQFSEQLMKEGKTNIKFLVDVKLPKNYLLNSDEFRIKQVLVNLIGNAIKFTARGSVTLKVNKKENVIHFKVIDTGIGISKEDQESVFQRFVQAKMSGKKNYGGTGLGLAISQNIVHLLGGKISVYSKLGQGSEFSFFIPV